MYENQKPANARLVKRSKILPNAWHINKNGAAVGPRDITAKMLAGWLAVRTGRAYGRGEIRALWRWA